MCDRLKLVHLFSAGVDAFLTHPIFTESDIAITTSSGIHGPPISEWILMTSLVHTKLYNITHENQTRHEWSRHEIHMEDVSDWVGRRVGIAGYGGIGRQGKSQSSSAPPRTGFTRLFARLLNPPTGHTTDRPYPSHSWTRLPRHGLHDTRLHSHPTHNTPIPKRHPLYHPWHRRPRRDLSFSMVQRHLESRPTYLPRSGPRHDHHVSAPYPRDDASPRCR